MNNGFVGRWIATINTPCFSLAGLVLLSASEQWHQADIAPATGLSESSVSRNVQWLGKKHRLPHRAGLQWVVQYQCPEEKNWRSKRVKLTALGRRIIQEALSPPRLPKDDLSEEALREAILSI